MKENAKINYTSPHPDGGELHDFYSRWPSRSLSPEEENRISEHVEKCASCRMFGEAIIERDWHIEEELAKPVTEQEQNLFSEISGFIENTVREELGLKRQHGASQAESAITHLQEYMDSIIDYYTGMLMDFGSINTDLAIGQVVLGDKELGDRLITLIDIPLSKVFRESTLAEKLPWQAPILRITTEGVMDNNLIAEYTASWNIPEGVTCDSTLRVVLREPSGKVCEVTLRSIGKSKAFGESLIQLYEDIALELYLERG